MVYAIIMNILHTFRPKKNLFCYSIYSISAQYYFLIYLYHQTIVERSLYISFLKVVVSICAPRCPEKQPLILQPPWRPVPQLLHLLLLYVLARTHILQLSLQQLQRVHRLLLLHLCLLHHRALPVAVRGLLGVFKEGIEDDEVVALGNVLGEGVVFLQEGDEFGGGLVVGEFSGLGVFLL